VATVTFNDGTARTLTNSVPVAAGQRLRGWTFRPVKVGPVRFGLGTGTRYVYEHRTDWKVSFSIEELKPSEIDVAGYLMNHLQGETKTCTINTADLAARTYTAWLGEDDEITLSGPDDTYRYTVTMTLTVTATTPPLCVYAA
jgi:hypothetical protein